MLLLQMVKRDLNKNIFSMKISKNYFLIYFMFLHFTFKSAYKNQLKSNKIQLKKLTVFHILLWIKIKT